MNKAMNIAIIGAGIGGLASAIYLARLGHKTTILERFKAAKPIGSGLLLQPPGQQVLDELDILDTVKSKSATITTLNSKTAKGKGILDLNYRDLEGPERSGLGISRALLHDSLLNKARQSGVNIVLGAEVCDIDKSSGKVQSNEKSYGTFDLIIIANGPRDILCDKYIKRSKHQYRWSCLWANVTLPADCPPDHLSQRCKSANYMIGLIPLNHRPDGTTEAAFFWSLRTRQLADWRAEPYKEFVEEVEDIWPSAAHAITSLKHKDFCHAIYYDIGCKKPWNDKIVAIGDAIHGTSPQLGQGATMALLDAKCLAKALENQPGIETALSTFWQMRNKQLRYVRWASKVITPLFQSNSRLLGLLRDLSSLKTTHSGFGKRLALETLASERDSFFPTSQSPSTTLNATKLHHFGQN